MHIFVFTYYSISIKLEIKIATVLKVIMLVENSIFFVTEDLKFNFGGVK